MNPPEGHRERLRQRFQADPASLSEEQCLELLLTYAIPRRDVTSLANELLVRYGSIKNILLESKDDLVQIPGIGESTVAFFQLLACIFVNDPMRPAENNPPKEQLALFDLKSEEKELITITQQAKQRHMRVFTNDEIANSLVFLPKAIEFSTFASYKQFLSEKLPYNAAETRQRRANCILERFYPGGTLDIPLTFFLARCSSQADLKAVVFYHVLKAEPIAVKVAEELVWSALPVGRVEREQMREFVMRYLPTAGTSSQKNMLRALFYTYDLLDIGSANDTTLRFQLHRGTLESFLYILTSEFSRPGIYSFEALFSGPLHRWMLWDREWIRQQLYNLQDFGILTKISEIDAVRQFTLAVDQPTALRHFFEHPERSRLSIHEQEENQGSGQEE